eukprot:6285-Heterococcus_DN1.PRE.2
MHTSSSVAGSNAARDTRICIAQQFIAILVAFVALEWQLYQVLPSSSCNYYIFQCLTSLFDLLALLMAFVLVSTVSTLTATAFTAHFLY